MLAKTNLSFINFLGAGSAHLPATGAASASPGGLGGGFQTILHSLRKGVRPAAGELVPELLMEKVELGEDGLPLDQKLLAIDAVTSREKVISEPDDFRMLAQLLGDLVSRSNASGKSSGLAVKSDLLGEMHFRFDPQSTKLTVTIDDSSGVDLEQALTGLFNLLPGLDIRKVEVVTADGAALPGDFFAGKDLVPGKIASALAGHGGVEDQATVHRRADAQQNTLASSSPDRAVASKTFGTGQVPAANGAEAKSGAVSGVMKLSDAQTIDALRSVIEAARELAPGSGDRKMQVALTSESKGKFVVETEQAAGNRTNRVYVNNVEVKKWLQQMLADQGIEVDEIVVTSQKPVRGLRAFDMETQTASAKVAEREVTGVRAPLSANTKVDGEQRATTAIPKLINKIASKVHELGDAGSGVGKELHVLANKLKAALAQGRSLNHEIKVDSPQAEKWLDKQLQPVLEQMAKERVPVERLVISRNGIVRKDLQEHAVSAQNTTKKTATTGPGKGHVVAKAQARNDTGSSLEDESNLSGGSEMKKDTVRALADSTTSARQIEGDFGAHVAAIEHGDGESVSFSTPGGTVHFETINGRLVATNAVHASNITEMIQKISELVENQAALTSRKLEVQMDVKDMGKVLVDAIKQAEKINLHVHVESTDARRLLEVQLRPLVEQMAREGIDIGKLDVSVRDDRPDTQAHFEFSEQNQDRNDASFRRESSNAANPGQPAQPARQMPGRQTTPADNGTQRLEIWA